MIKRFQIKTFFVCTPKKIIELLKPSKEVKAGAFDLHGKAHQKNILRLQKVRP